MNIYVCVKRVPDTESKIRINHDNNTIISEGLNFILSPYDEYAVEEALRLREAHGGKVVVISAGPEEATVILKKCLAMGADEAVLIKDDEPETYDGLRTAKIIAQALTAKFPDYSLLLFGRLSFGADNGQVQTMVAELLGLPQVNTVTKLEIDGNQGMAHREIEGGTEKVPFVLPAVISAQKGLNEPRYETLKGIMMAKRKQIPVVSLDEIGLDQEALQSNIAVVKLESPPPRSAGTVITDEPETAARKLVEYLRHEAKVL
jgi:electron transfer flavoprotein beta subunit